jgi:RNase P subunit RPR2
MNHRTYRHYANPAIESRLKRIGTTKMKKCAMCFIDKEVTEFSLNNRKYGDGRSSYCKPCQSTYYKAYNASRRTAQAKVILTAKTCRDCGLEKPINQFGKRELSPDKHNIYCKLCWRKRVTVAQRKMRNGG